MLYGPRRFQVEQEPAAYRIYDTSVLNAALLDVEWNLILLRLAYHWPGVGVIKDAVGY